jgi:hypothetical protein
VLKAGRERHFDHPVIDHETHGHLLGHVVVNDEHHTPVRIDDDEGQPVLLTCTSG